MELAPMKSVECEKRQAFAPLVSIRFDRVSMSRCAHKQETTGHQFSGAPFEPCDAARRPRTLITRLSYKCLRTFELKTNTSGAAAGTGTRGGEEALQLIIQFLIYGAGPAARPRAPPADVLRPTAGYRRVRGFFYGATPIIRCGGPGRRPSPPEQRRAARPPRAASPGFIKIKTRMLIASLACD
ncbi:hypothetical protein EVAR_45904_1 [Eumeta japonica]|uniref:Uncharacterized protein n=1 Tax=Eumeta variegata TaxID=151549 RepID=A0A4C1XSF6_EUMVA|nr:hypothetical protein EVAR_45904_1 [Eumeta japonica]